MSTNYKYIYAYLCIANSLERILSVRLYYSYLARIYSFAQNKLYFINKYVRNMECSRMSYTAYIEVQQIIEGINIMKDETLFILKHHLTNSYL